MTERPPKPPVVPRPQAEDLRAPEILTLEQIEKKISQLKQKLSEAGLEKDERIRETRSAEITNEIAKLTMEKIRMEREVGSRG